MTAVIELVPLNCLRCATPIPAQPNELGWVCGQCGLPQRLYDDERLVELDLNYSAGLRDGQTGRPFWVVEGQVQIDRDTQAALFNKKTAEAREFWARPVRFFIPAFECALEELMSLGKTLTLGQPALQPGSVVSFAPITVSTDDLQNLIGFIIVSIEAERSDQIKRIDFHAELGAPEIWILP